MSETQTRLAGALAHEADKLLACVHCGLCLEACPTYVHTGDENDSPRGRVYLMRAVAEARLPAAAPAYTRHLDRCLGCRACESACPAGVEYGQLLEAARADLTHTRPDKKLGARLLRFALRHIWPHPARLRLGFALARGLRATRAAELLLWTRLPHLTAPRFEFALALLASSAATPLSAHAPDAHIDKTAARPAGASATSAAPATTHAAAASNNARALLFTGCVTAGLFARVNRATARVLAVNGCALVVPPAQVCCGALHAHAGDLAGARALARRNIEALAAPDDAPIVTNAGGCGALLAAYAHLLADDPEYAARARTFSARVRDVSQQLAATGMRAGAAVAAPVTTYDASCHLLHGQHAQTEPLALLRAVPGLVFVPLADSDVCCGGAGVYNLMQPELSARVLAAKLAHVAATGATLLATGNPGCHMQIGAGARLARRPLRVCHPVELLDESYRRAGFYAETKLLPESLPESLLESLPEPLPEPLSEPLRESS